MDSSSQDIASVDCEVVSKVFDVETLEKIQRNKDRAILLRQERSLRQVQDDLHPPPSLHQVKDNLTDFPPPSSSSSDQVLCTQILEDEDICGQILAPGDMELWNIFGEKCCSGCKRRNHPDFELVSRDVLRTEYLIPVDSISLMKHSELANPKNPRWSSMHLYLRKHAREKSHRRWGGARGLQEEIERRGKEKFEREIEKTKNFFDVSLTSSDSIPTSEEDGNPSRNQGKKRKSTKDMFVNVAKSIMKK